MSAKRRLHRARLIAARKRSKKMQHRLIFGSWELPEGNEPAADHARVWASFNVAYKLPVSAQGQPGGANMGSAENLSAAMELSRMFRDTRESEKRNILALSGAYYILSNSAMDLLKGNWKALRSMLGAAEAEDVVLVEDFIEDIEEYDPNDEPNDEANDGGGPA